MNAEPAREPPEMCLRCGAHMEWRHATFQCPRCRFKIGCCEGETGDCGRDGAPPHRDRPFAALEHASKSRSDPGYYSPEALVER